MPIANELKKNGWNSLLVHRGSWEHEKGRPSSELIDGLNVRDFSFYNTRFVYNIIKREQPKAVLILTTNYLFDRAVILAARSLGVKSFFLMHGIRSVNKDAIKKQKSTTNNAVLSKRWLFINKYLFYLIPNYLYSGAINNWKFLLSSKTYSLLWKLFRKPHRYILFPPISNELHCDIALVWGNRYKQFFIEEYGYPRERVKVVGHPPLDEVFNLDQTYSNENKPQHIINIYRKPYCVYLEDGAVEQTVNEWNHKARLEHLNEIGQICNQLGYCLVVKLHPLTNGNPIIKSFFTNLNVKIISKPIQLGELVMLSEFVIGQGSTTNDIAIALNKPLILPAWGLMKPKSLVTSKRQPSAILASSPEDLIKIIQDINTYNARKQKSRNKYINEYITYTDGKAVKRIVKYLIS